MDVYERAEEIARSAAGNTVKAHGQMWTIAQAYARIRQLTAINEDPNGPGPSDGRVTEINNLRAALDAHDKLREEAYDRALRELQIQQWSEELSRLGPHDVETDRTIVALAGRYHTRQHRTYKTEQGFLRALIRIRRDGGTIIWAE